MATTATAKQKIWKFPEVHTPSPEMLALAGGSEIIAKLLIQRGFDTVQKAEIFLDPAKYEPTSPMVFSDMPKAIVRISKAIATQEKITVYGDYDVDGVTGTSVLYTVLKKLGANVDFYIPNRANEGYGLNLKAISVLASKHRTKLIISCDCGISNFAEINLAKSLKVDTIIVDHHSMPEILPPAVAILHPKQLAEDHPLFHLPGVGVAYKLCEALLLDNKMPEEVPKLHDFVTLGMIADMVPLVAENRYLVQIGLPALVNSPRAGIQALLDNTVKMDGSDIVGFGLAPRINAVGRLADANLAVKLMTVEDPVEAEDLARQLELENSRRQELCEEIFFEADKKAKLALASGQDRALALYAEDWHHGVVGIVASRLVEKYHCPVFVAELDKEEGKIKGSARGIAGIDLYQVLKANEHLMTKWGGHQMAAGFSAEAANADALCRAIVDTCNKMLAGQSMRAVLEIDLEIPSTEVHLGLAKSLRQLGPFGMWNKKPVLAMKSLQVLNTKVLGKEGKHHKLVLRSISGDGPFECVYWRSAGRIPEEGQEIDLAFSPDVNVFNNTERLQLVLNDWRPAGEEILEVEEEVIDFTPPKEPVAALAAPLGGASKKSDGGPGKKSIDGASSQEKMSAEGNPPAINKIAPAHTLSEKMVLHLETRYDGEREIASTSVTGLSEIIDAEPSANQATVATPIELNAAPAPIQADFEPSHVEAQEHLEGVAEAPFELERPTFEAEPAMLPPLKISVSNTESEKSASPTASRQATALQLSFKDLRDHGSPSGVVDAAVRKLGDKIQIFAEASKLAGHKLCDRTSLEEGRQLLIWQYPPSLQVFKALIAKSRPSQIYLCGGATVEHLEAPKFLQKLLSLVRFAVNQKEGQAQAEKLAAALSTTKMALALGLTILKKLNVIDWYAEDSMLYMEILGQPTESWDSLPEYRQLAHSLREVTEFRSWCAEASLDEVQSELVPNAIRVADNTSDEGSQADASTSDDSNLRVKYDERTSYPSGQS